MSHDARHGISNEDKKVQLMMTKCVVELLLALRLFELMTYRFIYGMYELNEVWCEVP